MLRPHATAIDAKNGLTQDLHREIAYYLKYFQGKAREIFVEQISNHPEIDMTP